jgi:hypothetical protein
MAGANLSGMPFEPRLIRTRCATMELTGPGFIEQRFLPEAVIDRAGFEENRAARHALAGDSPYVMLSVFPPGPDFDLAVTTSDHFAPERERMQLVALAVVTNDSMG